MDSSVHADLSLVLDVIQEASEKYKLDITELKERVAQINRTEIEANGQALLYALNQDWHGSTQLDISCGTFIFTGII